MHVIADVCIVPIGTETSVSRYIALCEDILIEAGLEIRVHAYGTNVEGEWDTVFAALKRCHEKLHTLGVARLSTSVKVGTRTDRQQSMDEKVTSVLQKMQNVPSASRKS